MSNYRCYMLVQQWNYLIRAVLERCVSGSFLAHQWSHVRRDSATSSHCWDWIEECVLNSLLPRCWKMNMEYYLCIFTFCFTVLLPRKSSDDDSIDRLNRKYTVYGLIALAVLSDLHLATTKVSSLISCWNRANFPPAYVKYTENICFVTNTYRLAANESIPEATSHRLFSERERMVNN